MKTNALAQSISTLTLSLLTAGLILLMLANPSEIVAASRAGLLLWFNQVLPSLLPFMIGVQILSALGFVRFIGTLLSPVMEPLFGVPGEGCFALAAGMISGYPMGAKITSDLRQTGELSQTQAQRLLGFTNNSGPLFILGTIGVGVFQSEKAGYFLMFVHYASAILTGLAFRFYGVRRGTSRAAPPVPRVNRLIPQALRSMNAARKKDGRALGAILGASVLHSMETITLVGGFIIFFSILAQSLALFAPMPNPWLRGIVTGLLEMTNGISILPNLTNFINLTNTPGGADRSLLLAAAGLISFGGFSIHAQSVVFIHQTDLKVSLYLLGKILQSGLSVLLAYSLYPLLW
ncbi:MAG: hypothetical protein LBT44_08275 [Clostridiales bacterium]|jgi:sporulation integral membrane protein YlbJ|nr:hypothetical protein [Clostridiales bacterium]